MARLANLGTSVTAQGLLLGMWLDCRIRCSRSPFNENHYLIPTCTPRIAAFPPAPLRALPHPNNNRGGHNPNLWPTSIRPVLVESWFPLSSNIISAPHRQQPCKSSLHASASHSSTFQPLNIINSPSATNSLRAALRAARAARACRAKD